MKLPSHSARRLGFGLLALALALAVHAPAARAQTAAKIFLSATGNDANAGTTTAPKRTFQAAHDALAAGGEIVPLNTAGYGALTITKSLVITVPTGLTGFITVGSGATGVTINAAATDVVTLRGLTIEGAGGSGSVGVFASSVGTLRVDNCTIRGFETGLSLAESTGTLQVTGGAVRDGSVGIAVSTPTADTVVTTTVTANVADCKIDNIATTGVYATAGAGSIVTTLTRCLVSHCQVSGIRAAGTGAITYVDDCIVSGNAVASDTVNSGTVVTRSTNVLTNNTTLDSGFGNTLAPQ